jgi:uncharacterized protein (DUF2267 family)
MSATGLDVFDKTLQTTNVWLDEITATLGPDRQLAWKVLSVVLHKLRDRMPVELSAHLSASSHSSCAASITINSSPRNSLPIGT